MEFLSFYCIWKIQVNWIKLFPITAISIAELQFPWQIDVQNQRLNWTKNVCYILELSWSSLIAIVFIQYCPYANFTFTWQVRKKKHHQIYKIKIEIAAKSWSVESFPKLFWWNHVFLLSWYSWFLWIIPLYIFRL